MLVTKKSVSQSRSIESFCTCHGRGVKATIDRRSSRITDNKKRPLQSWIHRESRQLSEGNLGGGRLDIRIRMLSILK